MLETGWVNEIKGGGEVSEISILIVETPSVQDLLYNSHLRTGLEFDCNSQASLDRGVRLLIDFNAFRNYIPFIVMGLNEMR